MSININTNQFQLEFSDRVELLLQESGSRLRSSVTNETVEGARSSSPVNQVGAISGSTPAGRFAPLNRVDAPTSRRWVDPTDRELPQLLDKFDMLKYSQDFKGPFAQNAAMDMGRFIDDLIIAGATGTSKTGELGTGTEAFDTTNYRIAANFGAASDVGLTVAKLIELQRVFMAAHVDLDMERPTLVISPRQHSDLLNQVQVVSTEFAEKPRLEEGRVKTFMGFDIIVKTQKAYLTSDALPLINTDERRCLAFVKSGINLSIWKDVETRLDERKDLSSIPWQIYTCASAGATRLEQGKVVEVLCDEG
jgi:hypothetical protein